MKLAVAVHQVGTSYVDSLLGPSDEPGTSNERDEAVDAIGAIYGKAFDGLSYMSLFDTHPAAVSSSAVVAAREQMHAQAGRGYIPWGVPHGIDPAAEGSLAAEVAIAAAGEGETAICILNIEPYAGFWVPRGEDGRAAARELVGSFLNAGGEELWLWTDARRWQLDYVEFSQWVAFGCVTRVLPETYWTVFAGSRQPTDVDVSDSIVEAVTLLAGYNVSPDRVHPTLPGDATPEHMVYGISECARLGTGRPNVWQRMNFRPETALAIAQLDDPWAGDPLDSDVPVVPPEPMPDPVRVALEHVDEASRLLREALGP